MVQGNPKLLELEAVRLGASAGNGLEARDLKQIFQKHGFVVYSVEEHRTNASRGRTLSPDQRTLKRSRTRLRSALLLDQSQQVLCETAIHDRSSKGYRLIIQRNHRLPPRFLVLDEELREVFSVTLAWRRDRHAGVRISSKAPSAMRDAIVGRIFRERFRFASSK